MYLLVLIFSFPSINNKIFDGKFPKISKKCSHLYSLKFKKKLRELFLIGIIHLH